MSEGLTILRRRTIRYLDFVFMPNDMCWYPVLLCRNCRSVMFHESASDGKDKGYILASRGGTTLLCGACGEEHENADSRIRAIARWRATWTWFNPLTWFTGYWEHRSEVEAARQLERFMEPVLPMEDSS